MSEPNVIKLTERKSPDDYIDGYRAALVWAKEQIERQIEMIDTVRKLQEAIKNEEEKLNHD
jgi:hypothetical protein